MTLTADIERRYRRGPAVRASLTAGRVTVLFGPSGCGKSTVLRCLAGLERPDAGRITLGDNVWFDASKRVDVPTRRRGVGYLFQQPMLFPHLTAGENVAFALAGRPAAERAARVAELSRRFGLTGLESRRPSELSGGQQQRVALARALAAGPKLLLLDEPLAALDAPARAELRPELRRILREAGVPAVVVTHSRAEAAALGDEVALMDATGVIQRGPPAEVFTRPAGPAAARIVGVESLRPGRVVDRRPEGVAVRVGSAELWAAPGLTSPDDVLVSIRGEEVILAPAPAPAVSARNRLTAVVRAVTPEGALVRVDLDAGFPLVALVTPSACAELNLAPGAPVVALVKAPAVHLMPAE